MIRQFAFLSGFIWLLLGFLGFLPTLLENAGPSGGLLFGVFPANLPLNTLHILLGVLGIVASGGYRAAARYARMAALLGAALALVGFLPMVGELPALALLARDVTWSHGLFALVAAYFGWGEPSRSYIVML